MRFLIPGLIGLLLSTFCTCSGFNAIQRPEAVNRQIGWPVLIVSVLILLTSITLLVLGIIELAKGSGGGKKRRGRSGPGELGIIDAIPMNYDTQKSIGIIMGLVFIGIGVVAGKAGDAGTGVLMCLPGFLFFVWGSAAHAKLSNKNETLGLFGFFGFFGIFIINQFPENPSRFGTRGKLVKPKRPKVSINTEEIAAKADATKAILKLLADTDEWFDPARLKGIVEKLFVMFQEGWKQNDLQPLGKYVASTCLDKYLDRYENDAKRLKMAKLDDLELTRIRFIHVEAYGDFETHTFTAYLEASGPEKYKECWTFIRTPKRWKLEQMKPIGSSMAVSQLNEVPAELFAELEAEEGNDDLLAYIDRG